ncbi:MAG: response regulator transcription factor [Bacteroidetes bacterium]|nr:response regulator transcription factor [Bacteroidota bacterium]
MKAQRILVVDDEEDLCEILKFNLEGEGFIVDVAHSAEGALAGKLDQYSLLLLDIMMGKMSGLKLAEKIRKEMKLTVPIIFITSKDTENDTLTGFSLGADDYISKPFSVREVIARIKAVLKRTSSKEENADNIIRVNNMEIDLKSKKVFVYKTPISLTKKEFEILLLLVQNPGRVFSRDEILSLIWKNDVIVVNRTIDVNIARIRKKLGSDCEKAFVSRSGYGYCFEPDNINI